MSDTPRSDEVFKAEYADTGAWRRAQALCEALERELSNRAKPGLFTTNFSPPVCSCCGKPCTGSYYMISGAEGVKAWHTAPGSIYPACSAEQESSTLHSK